MNPARYYARPKKTREIRKEHDYNVKCEIEWGEISSNSTCQTPKTTNETLELL